MRTPSFTELQAERVARQRDGNLCSSYARGVHPNPRFFKYYWWVFWKGSPVDGEDFLSRAYRLTTAEALQLMNHLQQENEPHWVYNRKLPRRDPGNTPFDPSSPHWEGVEWALPYDQDPDRIATGKGLDQK